jgi:hypothetical protein
LDHIVDKHRKDITVMKVQYTSPEIFVVNVAESDILTSSTVIGLPDIELPELP